MQHITNFLLKFKPKFLGRRIFPFLNATFVVAIFYLIAQVHVIIICLHVTQVV